MELLNRLRGYEDARTRVTEQFLEERLEPTDALALLAQPLGARRARGWVICPSVGVEHSHLRRLEGLVARQLAAAGFVSVRIRQDAGVQEPSLSLSHRLAEAGAAAELIVEKTGVEDVAIAGALFGGTAAALLADRLGFPEVALWEPVVNGGQYLREALRFQSISELVSTDEGIRDERSVRAGDDLRARGWTTVRGLRLDRDEHDRIAGVDLAADLGSFRGRALLVGVSPSGAPGRQIQHLADRLEALGADLTLEVVRDPLHAPFGEHYYRTNGLVRRDTRLALDRELARITVEWARLAERDRIRPQS